MEANVCGINHLDDNVLLPPRKRLLAGYKKQNSDYNVTPDVNVASHPPPVASSSLSGSPSASASFPPLNPTTTSSPIPLSPSSSEFQTRLDNILSSYFNKDHNVAPEKIMEASRTAAENAFNAAKAARAAAGEKAIIAARAIAAAKSALVLVASFPEEEVGAKDEVLKKHIQLQGLNEKANKLHRVINGSSRISKKSSCSESKVHKNKKHKSSLSFHRSMSNGNAPAKGNVVAGELGYEESLPEAYTCTLNNKLANKAIRSQMDNGEREPSYAREKGCVNTIFRGKKAGKLKLKMLPISIHNSKDSPTSKADLFPRSSTSAENTGNPTTHDKPFSPTKHCRSRTALASIDTPTKWKCQDFKAPECVKQNKVMQS